MKMIYPPKCVFSPLHGFVFVSLVNIKALLVLIEDFKLVIYFILWIHRLPINVLFKFHPLDRCFFIHKQDTFDFILGYNYDLGPIR